MINCSNTLDSKGTGICTIFFLESVVRQVTTIENLVKVGIQGINTMCVFFQNQEETISHLLFTCQKVSKIWYMLRA